MSLADPEIASPATDTIVNWLATNVGGTVTSIRRQPRWRPVWFVELDRVGEKLQLCVRGDRTDVELVLPLEHEMRFQAVLHEQGIPVPKVYGWIDDLRAFVMDTVPGRPDFNGVADDERDTIVDEYVQVLARMHQLDVAPFVAAGVERAARPEDSAQVGWARFERVYRKQKHRADPLMEFGLGWLRRNPPRSRGREGPVVWDSGQFHHQDGHLVSLVDLEIGHLGDPMMDLAGWRMRDSVIPFGDFSEIYERYGDLVGEPVDLDAIQLHHIAFTMSNSLSFADRLRNPEPDTDYMTYLQWCNETNLYVTEALAEYLDIELPVVDAPDTTVNQTSSAHHHLVRSLRSMQTDDELLRHNIRIAFRLAGHLDRYNEIGDAVESADLDDLEPILGHRPESWLEGEAELEQFVLADADVGKYDEPLIVLLHKRNLRAQMLNGPPGSAIARHNTIQPFRKQ
jgi:aminoglycoside phosphotransferase (APT) family kinase protein